MSKTCDCPDPPGGSITCSDEQLAMCGYRDGKIVSGCFDPPPSIAGMPTTLQRTAALSNWVLQEVTGKNRAFTDPVTSADRSVLYSGTFVNDRGERLRFVLPAQIRASSQGGAAATAAY
jgi:hypothetical protein